MNSYFIQCLSHLQEKKTNTKNREYIFKPLFKTISFLNKYIIKYNYRSIIKCRYFRIVIKTHNFNYLQYDLYFYISHLGLGFDALKSNKNTLLKTYFLPKNKQIKR